MRLVWADCCVHAASMLRDRNDSSVAQALLQGWLGVSKQVVLFCRCRTVACGVIGLILMAWQFLIEQRPVTTRRAK
ncbi:MAG TPA: hypothetical protein QF800_01795 [Phycisphaerales bacterium]|nr:hypothetical protein [Phycisphaerales bacterium]